MVTEGLGCESSFHKSENKSYDMVIGTNEKTKVYIISDLNLGFSGQGLQEYHLLLIVL